MASQHLHTTDEQRQHLDVPGIRVIGMRATMRMMKGMERPMLTIWESSQYSVGLRN